MFTLAGCASIVFCLRWYVSNSISNKYKDIGTPPRPLSSSGFVSPLIRKGPQRHANANADKDGSKLNVHLSPP